jgi:hypothetical protein
LVGLSRYVDAVALDNRDDRPRWWFERVLVVVVYVAVVVGAALSLWAGSHASLSLAPLLLGLALFGAAGFIAVMSAIALGPIARRWRWHTAVIVGVAVVAGGLSATDLPLRARWIASQSAFNREIGKLPPLSAADGDATITAPSHIGWFSISNVDPLPTGYVFTDASGGDTSDFGNGFAYMPDGPIPALEDEGYQFTHLGGAWYAWVGYS